MVQSMSFRLSLVSRLCQALNVHRNMHPNHQHSFNGLMELRADEVFWFLPGGILLVQRGIILHLHLQLHLHLGLGRHLQLHLIHRRRSSHRRPRARRVFITARIVIDPVVASLRFNT